ncbi:PepSY-associated TM helix domain-containing protein [Alkanindiges illinoisensis]|uniref:PepSY-associated TM helix domain-containing protein n=1 Tax=Alkanindiges illinoisensis TaxID=197183 RepID=UPI00047E44D1|nr:PepSY domain-containing protein [Alkanindiges illinoisensis]
MSTTLQQPPMNIDSSQASYRTLWRWHFYAGLFVMPLLMVLAVSGTLYCFKPQLELLLYPHLLIVQPQTTARLDANQLLVAAQQAAPAGSIPVSIPVNNSADRSSEFIFRFPDGGEHSVYVNPYTAKVLGSLSVSDRFMQTTRMLHRKLLLGKPGELLMELAACWTLVMIGTGIALWWPLRQPENRNTNRTGFWPQFSLEGRPFWKSLHASMGIWLAIGGIAFILTGLPWTGFWGKNFQALVGMTSLGAPPGVWGDLPLKSGQSGVQEISTPSHSASHHHDDASMSGMVMDQLPVAQLPWAVGQLPVPNSAATPLANQPVPISQVIAKLAAVGLMTDYTLTLPATPDGVYVATYFPADPKQERTLYIDQYSGKILHDIRYNDYGAISKAVSYGTSLHMGRYFGLANQIISALISVGLGAMALTGAIMWWKRRPAHSLGAPAREQTAPPMLSWKVGLVILGIIFPLMGVSLLVVWLIDRLLFSTR